MSSVPTGHPYEKPSPRLQPPPEYREMAAAVIANSNDIRDFLSRCAACGLPVDDRLKRVDEHCQFCQAFIANFYPE